MNNINLAERGPAGTTCGVTSCKVSANADGPGAAAAAAAAAMASCKDLLLQTPDPISRKLLPLLLAVSPLCTAKIFYCMHMLHSKLMATHAGVLTWTLASELSTCRAQHLVALGRLAELKAARDRPVQAGADNINLQGSCA